MSLYKPETVICNGETFKVYLSEKQIQDRVVEIAKQLNRDYADKKPIFIGVLNGAFVFLSDLLRNVTIPSEVDFLKLSSYGDEKVSSGQVTDLKDIDANIEERHILLVEDIVDTGLSMKYMVNKLQRKNPASIATVTLLHKPEATHHDVPLDYVGFEIPSLFVLGYGLDYAQEGRNLAQIYILDGEQ
ncbi:hypoxanthine phosphoribosyltransferase [Aliifodinibius sp. S!AR15-10]|uniref:hypoxanthine phosphoribosyltransferase n=1 Tax=Aliifodinibius sp. S!AR15-10 TaxID=2950437 RepID=UPI002856A1EE|nr:hypoxanthine phosphoribosyltransferase [Aliifodinibius sp. S!AR15-10]MDR8394056.1 hypoxanthine phosphoribosyltransferase [Aliifodinibius sp. S!AR15-10]